MKERKEKKVKKREKVFMVLLADEVMKLVC